MMMRSRLRAHRQRLRLSRNPVGTAAVCLFLACALFAYGLQRGQANYDLALVCLILGVIQLARAYPLLLRRHRAGRLSRSRNAHPFAPRRGAPTT
jgi:transcription initiation factor TFIIIB Brf1 subunit/transcription initiation factor TFIIB